MKPVEDSEGKPISKQVEQSKHCTDHIKGHSNRPSPEIRHADTQLPVKTNPQTKSEALKDLRLLEAGKAPGQDAIHPQTLETDTETLADMRAPPLENLWEEARNLPSNWKKTTLQIAKQD